MTNAYINRNVQTVRSLLRSGDAELAGLIAKTSVGSARDQVRAHYAVAIKAASAPLPESSLFFGITQTPSLNDAVACSMVAHDLGISRDMVYMLRATEADHA